MADVKTLAVFIFAFERSGFRLMFLHSTGSSEEGSFRPEDFARAARASSLPLIVFGHVPVAPPAGKAPRMMLNGHRHRFVIRKEGGTVFPQVPRVRGGQWVRADVFDDRLEVIQQPSGDRHVLRFD